MATIIGVLISSVIIFEPPLYALSIGLLLLVMIIMFLYYLGERRGRPSPFVLGRIIADYHLDQIRSIPEFTNLELSQSYPIYALNGNQPVAYDVKLVDNSGADKGFILVNLDRSDSPVVFFTSVGLSITELLRRQAEEEDFKVVYLSPTYLVALNAENRIVGSIGDYILKKETVERYTDREISTLEHLSLIRDEMQEHLSSFKKVTREEWEELLQEAGGGTKGKVKESLPRPDRFDIYYAEGYERSPKLKQIRKNTGVNTTGNWSGCGPTAWAMFIRWHDLLWTPELLRGSQDINSTAWGWSSNPNSEEEDNCYNDRIIMELNEHLDVFGSPSNDTGYNWDGDMERGFHYIHNHLHHHTSSETHWESHSTSVERAYEYISEKARPAVIKTPGHYCVLAGFCRRKDSDKYDKQWIYINTGWHDPETGFLKAKHLKEMWYTSHIRPRTQVTYNQLVGKKGVELCVTTHLSPDLFPYNMWAFSLTEDGKISYVKMWSLELAFGPKLLNPETLVTLNVTSIHPPSTCVDNNAVYLIYVDEQKKIHLMEYLLWKEDPALPEADRWKELSFPDIVTDVRPVITGGSGDWLTIVFCNLENGVQKIATNKDVERPNAWPENCFTEGVLSNDMIATAQSSWLPIGGVDGRTHHGLCIVRFRDRTVIGWINDDKVSFWASEGGEWGGYFESVEKPWLWWYGTPSLMAFNNTLFLITSGSLEVYNIRIQQWPGFFNYYTTNQEGYMVVSQEYRIGEVKIVESCRLTETTVHDPSIASWGDSVVLGWLDEDNRLTTRIISIDTALEPISYDGYP